MKRVFLVFILVLLGSCRNENQSISQQNFLENEKVTKIDIKHKISKEDAVKIGELHNQYLDAIFKDFDYNSLNVEKQIRDKFKLIDPELYQLNQSKFENYKSPFTEKEKILNDVDNSIIAKIISDIEKNSNIFINYDVFSNHLDNTLLKYKDKISAENYDVLLVAFEVMKKSYLYWSRKENDGIGKGIVVIKKMEKLRNNTMSKSTSRTIQKVIADDAMGAAGAFIGNAYFWSGGPASYFGSVAFSAAFSSAMSSAWGR